MGRRKGFLASLAQAQREAERREKSRQREAERLSRAAETAARRLERERRSEERERERTRRERYLVSRQDEVERLNDELRRRNEAIESLLHSALAMSGPLDFESLKPRLVLPPFEAGSLATSEPTPSLNDFLPSTPSRLQLLLPGAREKLERQTIEGRQRFEEAVAAHRDRETQRQARLADKHAEYLRRVEHLKAKAAADAAAIDALRDGYNDCTPKAVERYFELVMNRAGGPNTFPVSHKLAYVSESRQLVVEIELPGIEVVPEVRTYTYTAKTDTIRTSPLDLRRTKALYTSLVAQLTLRSVHIVLAADTRNYVETVTVSGFVDATDPTTGRMVRPCLVSLRASAEEFRALELSRVDPIACLKHLKATFSRDPGGLEPVRPVVFFDMVDARFVEATNVLGELDDRTNLMQLSPTEFEFLITNLFERMGLETRQTRSSRDRGVDCVAWDARPIFGGKVIIQAKRYKGTVGVSAVRDLYGTMLNEGAAKGILVTTSGYGKASFEFANNKPIELIDGSNLLFLLAEFAGIQAQIVVPDNWQD